MEFLHTDPKSLLSEIKEHEKQLIFKRRWLMGLPTSKSRRKKLQPPTFFKSESVPESLLREDDVFYETLRLFIEKGFGESSSGRGHHIAHSHITLLNSPNVFRLLSSLTDDLTSKGLYDLASLLTGGSVIEKTRKKMKKIVKKNISNLTKCYSTNDQQVDLLGQLTQFLCDKDNFQNNCLTHWTAPMQYDQAAVAEVLDGLDDMPLQTLDAMLRKLRSVPGRVPRFPPPKSERNKDCLVNIVKNTCLEIVSELGEQDELPEPLAKAMAVAKLSLKLTLGHNPFTTEFYQFSSQQVAVQNEIIKALPWLREVKVDKLKKLQAVLDPNAEISIRSLRTALMTMMTEYLFECGDIDTTPKLFSDALTVIKEESKSLGKYEEIEEEIECVLSISAHMKQILLELLPDCRFDQDFIDAYMEDFEESDDTDIYEGEQHSEFYGSQASKVHSSYPNEQFESMGDTSPTDWKPCIYFSKGINNSELVTPNGNNYKAEEIVELSTTSRSDSMQVVLDNESQTSELKTSPNNDAINPPNFSTSNFSYVEAKHLSECPSSSKNEYCAIQDVCDKLSVVSYFLIGRVLEMFAQKEHFELSFSAESYLRCNFSIYEDFQGDSKLSMGMHIYSTNETDVVD